MKAGVYACLLLLAASLLASCDEFLDTMPDNRTEVDEPNKVTDLLVSAYPVHDYIFFNELMSDNMDCYPRYSSHTSLADSCWMWSEVSEEATFSPANLWSDCFGGITTANMALEAIENLGGPTTTELREAKAEALMLRAYHHFILVNTFCAPYDKAKNAQNLGIPYQYEVERELNPQYDRGTLDKTYELIQKDIEEALPNIGETNIEDAPKYHFNINAAYAFATRFYLFTEQWQKAIDAATLCLGDNPATMLRDWKYMSTLPQNKDAVTNQYINADENANLLLLTSYSDAGLIFGAYRLNSRFSHGGYLAETEDMSASQLWGNYSAFYMTPQVYSATNMDKTIFWKLPYIFEYTDPVAKIGYRHTVYPAFTSDETLLSRAEAHIMLKQYDKACEDMTMWMHAITKSQIVLTPEIVNEFYNNAKYSYSDKDGIESQLKKHLNPSFAIDAEGSTQENMLQAVLTFRRIETMHLGLRWFDIKRYGIEIPRRVMNAEGKPERQLDFLKKDDPRRALQLPIKVIMAGLEGNPR